MKKIGAVAGALPILDGTPVEFTSLLHTHTYIYICMYIYRAIYNLLVHLDINDIIDSYNMHSLSQLPCKTNIAQLSGCLHQG